MDRENILSEGFFAKLLSGLKKAKSNSKIKKDKEVQKAYDDALKTVDDANKSLIAIFKKRGIKDPFG